MKLNSTRFGYQWIEEVHTYKLVANLHVGVSYQAFCIENPGRGLQQPPSKDVLQKILREDEG